MTTLHLIRHGQTDWNLAGRYQGQADVPLNDCGRAQASLLAARLAGARFDAIFSSDLSRALETARALAALTGLPVHTDRRLREIHQGEWEGMLIHDIRDGYPERFARAQVDPLLPRAPGGESVGQVAGRMSSAADEIARAHPGGTVLLVSHGLAIAALYCLARRLPLSEAYSHIPDNCAPVVVHWPPQRSPL